jgi:predicted ATPase
MSIDDIRPVRRVQRSAHAAYDRGAWPFNLPAIRQLLEEGLDLPAGVTLLVGENGSGKSTIIEALAEAYGLNAEGGSRGAQHTTRATESPLGSALQLIRSPGRLVSSYFLRAETMHGLYSYLEAHPSERRVEPRFHEMSHGESFLAILRERFAGYGFFLMDEPEAALSFTSSLGLLALLDDLRREGAQVVIATHSPLVAALPGATLIELGEHGLSQDAYDDLDLLHNWRGFLDAPDRYLRHLLE